MFLGTFEHSMDEKGRISMPMRFREALLGNNGDARMVITTNVDPGARCLVAYPVAGWQGFVERIADLPQFDENVIRLKRLHIAGATECAVDRQGRVLVPPVLRDYAALKGTVVFAGLGSCIEIWDRPLWNEERERAKQALPEINNALARFGL